MRTFLFTSILPRRVAVLLLALAAMLLLPGAQTAQAQTSVPGISSVTIEGRHVRINLTGNRSGRPLTESWTLKVEGLSYSLTSAKFGGQSIELWFWDQLPAVVGGMTVTLSYNKDKAAHASISGSSKLGVGGSEVNSFSNLPVTNNSPGTYVPQPRPPERVLPTAGGSLIDIPEASLDGDELTLTFERALFESSVPPTSAFTVQVARNGFWFPDYTCGLCRPSVTEVSISGKTVTLTLSNAIPSYFEARVSYRVPAPPTPPLSAARTLDRGRPWHFDFNKVPVTILTAETEPPPPTVYSATIRQSIRPENQYTVLTGVHRVEDLPPVERWSKLAVVFDDHVDANSLPPASAFTVTARPPGGSAVTVSGTGTVERQSSYNTIVLKLAEPVARAAEVTMSYVKPSANALRGRTGVQVESFSGVSVTNHDSGSAAPEVVSLAVASDPGPDRTYHQGETIRAQVTFSGDVHVTGTPRLRLIMGRSHWAGQPPDYPRGGAYRPWADYESGSGTRTLTFAYTVKELDRSDGIAVDDRLETNGGSIDSWAFRGSAATAPDLRIPWRLDYDGNHQVDGSPTKVTSVAVVSNAGEDNTYGAGDKILVQVTFNRPVDVTGTPRLKIKMDPSFGEKWAVYEEGSGGSSLTFAYTVVSPNKSTQGIAVLTNTLELNGGTIRVGNSEANLAHDGLAHDTAHMVDATAAGGDNGGASGAGGASGQSGGGSGAVTGVSVVSDAGADRTYGEGDQIEVRVIFDAPVDVTGLPRLKIDMDPADWGEKWASYEGGSGTNALTFVHTVAEPNLSTQGIAVLANSLELDGGTIRANGADADLAHPGLSHDANHKVDWQATPDARP